jgi:hypothetical protein
MSNWRDPTEEDLGPQESQRRVKRAKGSSHSSTDKSVTCNPSPSRLWRYLSFFLIICIVIQFLYMHRKINQIQQQNELLQQQIYRIQGSLYAPQGR